MMSSSCQIVNRQQHTRHLMTVRSTRGKISGAQMGSPSSAVCLSRLRHLLTSSSRQTSFLVHPMRAAMQVRPCTRHFRWSQVSRRWHRGRSRRQVSRKLGSRKMPIHSLFATNTSWEAIASDTTRGAPQSAPCSSFTTRQ